MDRSLKPDLCSFCAKTRAEVAVLIEGPGVAICDTCVLICKQVVDHRVGKTANKSTVRELTHQK